MSNAPKHTPGPWRVEKPYLDDEGYREIPIQADVDGKTVTPAAVCLQFPNLGEMQEANARLIAAAPELFEVVEALLAIREQKWMEASVALDEHSPLIDAARIAVAKVLK